MADWQANLSFDWTNVGLNIFGGITIWGGGSLPFLEESGSVVPIWDFIAPGSDQYAH